jgi:hypothetical protein
VESRKGKGFRLDLGDKLEAKFAAFAATYYAKTKTDIIREALASHMERELAADRERRRRYYHNLATGEGRRRARRGDEAN